MKIRQTLVLLGAAAGLAAIGTPALASVGTPPTHPTHPTHPAHPAHPAQPTQSTGTAIGSQAGSTKSLPPQAKAYGRYCQSESKTHVAGTPGTPFSTCVKDMAKAAKSPAPNPHRVCLNESKTHVAHTKGTPYSQCVSGAERLLKDMARKSS